MEKEEVITDQHFLPQCYLKGFANEKGKLYVLNLETLIKYGKTPPTKEYTPAQLCYEPDFYTLGEGMEAFNVKNVSDKYHIEKKFHEYEQHYNNLIQTIENGEFLTSNEASFLLRIIFDFKFRNKYFRDKIIGPYQAKFINNASEEIGKLIANDPEFLEKYEGLTVEEVLAISDNIKEKLLNDSNFKKNAHLSALYRQDDGYTEALNLITEKLLYCPWIIMESDGLFISNDNPGFSIDKDNNLNNFLVDKEFLLFMPITSSLCLTISNAFVDKDFQKESNTKKFLKQPAEQEMIDASNNSALRYLNKFVYGSNETQLTQMSKKLIVLKP